jgi:hypothetical protein
MLSDKQLIRSTPEDEGIPSASILKFIDEVEKNIHEFHSFMLLRHGKIIADGWWLPYAPQIPHTLWSLSKSFTSSGIGFAVNEGYLTVDDPVISFFPEDLPGQISQNLVDMRVRHLLSMSTGHAEDTTEALMETQDGNWVKTFLGLPVQYTPGTHFLYNTGATYILSAIVQKVTGMTLLDYLTPRLFEPLGIVGATWDTSPQGVNMGGFGLNIKTEDIARFGQLYLQKGQWNGRTILPAAWIAEATTSQIANGPNPNPDWEQGYGYQFWRSQHQSYRGDGACGQFCLVLPEQDAVLAITAGTDDMQAILNQVWENLLPGMGSSSLPVDLPAQKRLEEKLSSLKSPIPAGVTPAFDFKKISGKWFLIEGDEPWLEHLSFTFSETGCLLKWKTRGREEQFTCDHSNWIEGFSTLLGSEPAKIAASGFWTTENTYSMILRLIETSFYFTISTRFDADRIYVETNPNVTFGNLGLPALKGKLAGK